MKIFVDSANLDEIEDALKRGFAAGVTTNPSIMSKEKRTDFGMHIRRIIELLQSCECPIPLSVEVFSGAPRDGAPGPGVSRTVRRLPRAKHQGADRLERA